MIFAHIKNTRTPFGLDVGIGEVIIPKQVKRTIPTQIDGFNTPKIGSYSLESVIAEKLDAIFSMMEFSSKMKDYFDIYYLSRNFTFDNKILVQAISKTFENRERDFTINDFQHVIAFDDNKYIPTTMMSYSSSISILLFSLKYFIIASFGIFIILYI